MIVILGNGGHARVCMDILKYRFPTEKIESCQFDPAESFSSESGLRYVIGVGDIWLRRRLYDEIMGGVIEVIHQTAILPFNRYSDYTQGAQIMAGVVIQPYVLLGHNVLINTGAQIDHDCIIGDHCHIAPGAILCGGVTVGEGAFIGAGAVIPEGRKIPDNAFVPAGTVFK